MRTKEVKIDEIYVPADRRKELDPQKVEEIAEQIIEEVAQRPIQVRRGKDRFVLIKGVNRLEAQKALGNETIEAAIVAARLH